MNEIYEVRHSCGWGPYGSVFFKTQKGAKTFAATFLRETRARENFIKGTLKKRDKKTLYQSEQSKDKNAVKLVAEWSWEMMNESNNESGHEYWDEGEMLEIIKITLLE